MSEKIAMVPDQGVEGYFRQRTAPPVDPFWVGPIAFEITRPFRVYLGVYQLSLGSLFAAMHVSRPQLP